LICAAVHCGNALVFTRRPAKRIEYFSTTAGAQVVGLADGVVELRPMLTGFVDVPALVGDVEAVTL
jgi:hypothetical protein